MKVRSHILLRFRELKSKKSLLNFKKDDEGHYCYSFNTKVVLVVNELEHNQIQKQLSKESL